MYPVGRAACVKRATLTGRAGDRHARPLSRQPLGKPPQRRCPGQSGASKLIPRVGADALQTILIPRSRAQTMASPRLCTSILL